MIGAIFDFFKSGDLLMLLFTAIGFAMLLFILLPVHEFAHALAAHKLGDDTAKWNGRLTVNPLRHYDPIGSTMILLIGYGWARPVPVNPRNFDRVSPRTGMALTALAGPVSNLIMALAAVLLYRGLLWLPLSAELMMYLQVLLIWVFAYFSVSLAIFNLIPVPPLDGSRIFARILPASWAMWLDRYEQLIGIVFFVLIMTHTLTVPISWLTDWIMRGMLMLTGLW